MTKQPPTGITPALYLRRHILRVSQADVAAALGITQPMVSKLERMDSVPVSYRDGFNALAKHVGVKIKRAWFTQVPMK